MRIRPTAAMHVADMFTTYSSRSEHMLILKRSENGMKCKTASSSTAAGRPKSRVRAVWAAAALSEPLGRWLLDPVDHDVAGAGSRHVGRADVDAVWSMCTAFADADRRMGGGHARRTVICYADLCRARHKSAYAEGRIMPTVLADAVASWLLAGSGSA